MFDEKFIRQFHDRYFADLVWRRKTGVRFGSAEHRATKLSDMVYYLIEERIVEEYIEEKSVGYSRRESDDIFENIKKQFELEKQEFIKKKNGENMTQA